eukprot:766058-Hanusia_phi.AAC.10
MKIAKLRKSGHANEKSGEELDLASKLLRFQCKISDSVHSTHHMREQKGNFPFGPDEVCGTATIPLKKPRNSKKQRFLIPVFSCKEEEEQGAKGMDASESVELAGEAEQDLKEDLKDERRQKPVKGAAQLPIPLPLKGEQEFERFSLLGLDFSSCARHRRDRPTKSEELVRTKEEAKQELVAGSNA